MLGTVLERRYFSYSWSCSCLAALLASSVVASAQTSPPPSAPATAQPAAPPSQLPRPASAQWSVAQPAPPPPAVDAPPPPQGDIRHFHDRFYLRLGLGGGSLHTSGKFDPDLGTTLELSGGGPAFDLSIGGTPAPGFVVGGSYLFQQATQPRFTLANGSQTVSGDAENNAVLGLFGPFIDWFPDPAGGFHVGALVAFGLLTVADQSGQIKDSSDETGPAGAFRIGYDLWVADAWSIGILGQALAGSVSSKPVNGIQEKDTFTSFGLQVSALYH
jgi:hypothetical protein